MSPPVTRAELYVAGYYAHKAGMPDDRESVLAKMKEIIAMGQGVTA